MAQYPSHRKSGDSPLETNTHPKDAGIAAVMIVSKISIATAMIAILITRVPGVCGASDTRQ